MTAFLLVVALATLTFVYLKLNEAKALLKKFEPIIDLESEIKSHEHSKSLLEQSLATLKSEVEKLTQEAALLNSENDLIESGFYQSKYDFDNSEKFEKELEKIREEQKNLIKDKKAVICRTSWEVGGSKAEGKKMIDRVVKLGLSAFNVQCDNEILKVRFNNVDKSKDKILKIRETINKLLEPNQCEITPEFHNLKIKELWLTYEYQQMVQAEKEEQKMLREQMREEEKAKREAERAEAEATREESRYEKALVKAREELDSQSDAEKEMFAAKIKELEFKLKEAQENKERAKSMAELTRRGHVYIISNIGSFGEHVYKIGMTRRLDPLDRIDELGDASVPFEFDIHALIKSDDAPALEKMLHQQFNNHRLNLVNERKEFFKVNLDAIEAECKKIHKLEFKITKLAEAREYRQTVALRKKEDSNAA